VFTSDEALANPIPPKAMAIIGGGAVGVELASFYATFGAHVTIIETAPSLLPKEDREVSFLLKRSMEKMGITVLTSSLIDSIKDQETDFMIHLNGGATIQTDAVLVAIGRRPNTDGLDLKKAGVTVEANRAIWVNEKMQTSQRGVWAVGDVTTRPALAHGAMAQGIYVVETIGGIEREPIDPQSVPNAIYCHPEVASVGLTEEQARAAGEKIRVAKFPFAANPRAMIGNETEGFVKLICEEMTGTILGAHLIGPHATELIAEFVLAKHLGASGLDLKRAIHPHPTLSESVMEAGGAIFNQAIHF
jgi:dihydrolipoamide dehydrogenase